MSAMNSLQKTAINIGVDVLIKSEWENHYVHRTLGKDGVIEPLPDISNLLKAEEHAAVETESLTGD